MRISEEKKTKKKHVCEDEDDDPDAKMRACLRYGVRLSFSDGRYSVLLISNCVPPCSHCI